MRPQTPTEQSLLVYLETCMVDGSGMVDSAKINGEDFRILKSWVEDKYVKFSRLPAKWLTIQRKHSLGGIRPNFGIPHQVRLSDEAWADAHQLRRERSVRMTSEEKLRLKFQKHYDQAMEMLDHVS